jgi:hypothetical protein
MRLNYREVLPDALKAMLGLERVANGGLESGAPAELTTSSRATSHRSKSSHSRSRSSRSTAGIV